MKKYIDIDLLVAEIESKKKYAQILGDNAINSSMQQFYDGMKLACIDILSFLNNLEVKEVKEVSNWHLQEKENIYDAVKDWSLHTFVCVMKDGTIQKFTGSRDEDYKGHINTHIDGVNDDYDNVDDIVKWIEIT